MVKSMITVDFMQSYLFAITFSRNVIERAKFHPDHFLHIISEKMESAMVMLSTYPDSIGSLVLFISFSMNIDIISQLLKSVFTLTMRYGQILSPLRHIDTMLKIVILNQASQTSR